MGNNNSSNRHSRPVVDPTWSQTYPRPRAWINSSNDDRFRPYSPPGHKTQDNLLGPKSLPVKNDEMEFIQSESKQDHLPIYSRYAVTAAEPAPIQKIKVLPNAVPVAPKLRATDNGLALQQIGTISNRKLNEQLNTRAAKPVHHPAPQRHQLNQQPPTVSEETATRSPTPDYNGSHQSRGSKKYKAPTVPSPEVESAVLTTANAGRDGAVRSKSKESRRDRQSVERIDDGEANETENRPHSASENRGSGKKDHGRKLRLFKTKSDNKYAKEDSSQQIRARSMEYLRADITHETQEVRSSREDMSMLGIGSGPVTVFSSQKKMDAVGDSWDEPDCRPGVQRNLVSYKENVQTKQVAPSLGRRESSATPETSPLATCNDHPSKDIKQFYFGMTPGDVAVASTAKEVAPLGPASVDLDEESRKVMEEFDAVLAESRKTEMAQHASRSDKDKDKDRRHGKNRHRSPPPPQPSTPVANHAQKKKADQRKLSSNGMNDDDDFDDESADIALNLRPTLPKKPLQLPRFSPSAAWKALGGMSNLRDANNSGSSISDRREMSPANRHHHSLQQSSKSSELSEDEEDVFEERISRNARPVAPLLPRVSNEKSADSGISGDAGSPDGLHHPNSDKPLAMSSPVPHHNEPNWTPEQDLGDSSNEADGDRERESRVSQRRKERRSSTPPKIIPKSQMFPATVNDSTETQSRSSSVSKGRKYRKKSETTPIDSEPNNAPQKYNSLRKLKRSVSGAFAMMAIRSRSKSPDIRSLGENDNWVLSRSAPNSIINGSPAIHRYRPAFFRSEADLRTELGIAPIGFQYPAYSQPIITQRIVYLPQYDTRKRSSAGPSQDMIRRAKSADALYLESKNVMIPSSSMFDIGHHNQSTPKSLAPSHRAARRLAGKKFTFQSTVRVHQKKLLEEKLNKEAEAKERKRLQEVEAMQRVEEEFQRKRAREKANIREQLRMLQFQSKKRLTEPEAHYSNNMATMDYRPDQFALASPGHYVTKDVIARKRLDPEGAPSTSHNRSPTHENSSPYHRKDSERNIDNRNAKENQQRTDSNRLAMFGGRHHRSTEANHKLRASSSPEEGSREQSTRFDLRREVISSSRTRSGQLNPTPTEYFNDVTSRGQSQPKPAPAGHHHKSTPEKKKSIYKRLAEITSEEEIIASPPPVPLVANPMKPAKESRIPVSAHKAMTQELSEYRQERREYRDYRSPRNYPMANTNHHRSSTPGRNSQGSPRTQPSSINVSDNYRWDFARGVGARPMKVVWPQNFPREYQILANGEMHSYHPPSDPLRSQHRH